MELFAILFLYFLPAMSAYARHHNESASILVINLFLGWTLIGWVFALAWAATSNVRKPV